MSPSRPLTSRHSFFTTASSREVLLSTLDRLSRPSHTPQPLPDGLVGGTVALSLWGVGLLVDVGHDLALLPALAAWAPLKRPDQTVIDEEPQDDQATSIEGRRGTIDPHQVSPFFLPLSFLSHTLKPRKLARLVFHTGLLVVRNLPGLCLATVVYGLGHSGGFPAFQDAPSGLWGFLGKASVDALLLPLGLEWVRMAVSILSSCEMPLPLTLSLLGQLPSGFKVLVSRLTSSVTSSLLKVTSDKAFSTARRSLVLFSQASWLARPLHLISAAAVYLVSTAIEGAWETILIRWAIQDHTIVAATSRAGRSVFKGWFTPWPTSIVHVGRSPRHVIASSLSASASASTSTADRHEEPEQSRILQEARVILRHRPDGDERSTRSGAPSPAPAPEPEPEPEVEDGQEALETLPTSIEASVEGGCDVDKPPTPGDEAPSVAPSSVSATDEMSERLVEGSGSPTDSVSGEQEQEASNEQTPEVQRQLLTASQPTPEVGEEALDSSHETIQQSMPSPSPPSSLPPLSTASQLSQARARNEHVLLWRSLQQAFSAPHDLGATYEASMFLSSNPAAAASFLTPRDPGAAARDEAVIRLRPTTQISSYPPNALETLSIIVEEEGPLAPLRGIGSKILARTFSTVLNLIAEEMWRRR